MKSIWVDRARNSISYMLRVAISYMLWVAIAIIFIAVVNEGCRERREAKQKPSANNLEQRVNNISFPLPLTEKEKKLQALKEEILEYIKEGKNLAIQFEKKQVLKEENDGENRCRNKKSKCLICGKCKYHCWCNRCGTLIAGDDHRPKWDKCGKCLYGKCICINDESVCDLRCNTCGQCTKHNYICHQNGEDK